MISKTRVLIVDDSVVIRKIVSDVLSEDPAIEIAGVAAHGKIALEKIPQINPHVVTLDMEMPEMNGIETLKKIREIYPKLPVIMFSTLTERGARQTLEALACGASDYVTKPANVGSVTAAREKVRAELTEKIKAFTTVKKITPAKPIIPSSVAEFPIEVVAIGASTGGPNALLELFAQFPPSFPCPIVVTQHMPPMFTRMLAERITAKTPLKAFEGTEGMELLPGCIYIAPGDYHMEFVKKGVKAVIRLMQSPPENSCRPAVDVMFRSAISLFGNRLLGVILTGMGYDGMLGCRTLKEVGGTVLAQDEQSSVVWGMPGAVVEAGLADAIIPINQMQEEIVRRVMKKSFVRKIDETARIRSMI